VPKVCVLKSNYDFKTRYSLVTNPISGFTKTARDPFTVQGWRVRRGTTGLTELTWQPVASLTVPWLGCDHKPNGIDAIHKIHNQNLCNFAVGTLGVRKCLISKL
jgi:hypothetical protein